MQGRGDLEEGRIRQRRRPARDLSPGAAGGGPGADAASAPGPAGPGDLAAASAGDDALRPALTEADWAESIRVARKWVGIRTRSMVIGHRPANADDREEILAHVYLRVAMAAQVWDGRRPWPTLALCTIKWALDEAMATYGTHGWGPRLDRCSPARREWESALACVGDLSPVQAEQYESGVEDLRPGVERQVMAAQEAEAVRAAVQELPAAQREIIRLAGAGEDRLSIARVRGVSVSAVDHCLRRGRARLQAALQRAGWAE